ncbi:hypothetical protein BB558_003372 [Smittium angustum]|uniref:Radical S-adenosyl methionine domain-containing protein 1, mitochondrial n=1 Tax=Smittium angustum TaxID=133377 RepID=A0A2U1J654_SMIAN|nr:hypothetical protein BB558_003372 [Smittium angustum]
MKTLLHINKHAKAFSNKTEIPTDLSLYIHWPYCEFKCNFCNFNKYVDINSPNSKVESSILKEIQHRLRKERDRRIKSIYFGGGTPSLSSPRFVSEVINLVSKMCILPSDTEITLETNPTLVEIEKMKSFHFAGINRCSIGIQSFKDSILSWMGRDHTGRDAVQAIETARKIFNTGVTYDLIYGVPNQTTESFKKELEYALSLSSYHLSIYQLTVEFGTRLHKDIKAGSIKLPDVDTLADMYETAFEVSKNQGVNRYEVSNYAKGSNLEGKHNRHYWEGGDYIGVGPGSHSRYTISDDPGNGKISTINIRDPKSYMESVATVNHAIAKRVDISSRDELEELIVFGLRTIYGVKNSSIDRITNGRKSLKNIFGLETVQRYIDDGYLEWVLNESDNQTTRSNLKLEGKIPNALVPTNKGMQVIDTITLELISTLQYP